MINIFVFKSLSYYNQLKYVIKKSMQGQVNKTKNDTQLPKIYSQKRIHTAIDRRYTEDDTALANRPLSNNGRTKSMRAFTSKSVKYETTGNMYNKKIDDIQKQNFLIQGQMKNIQDEINHLRLTIGNQKKQNGLSRLNQSRASLMSKISIRKISLTDEETIKSQLKTIEGKIQNSRNKIDGHLQKNKTIQQQVNAFRKEISTLKTINQQLQASFKITSIQYEQQMELSKKLDGQIAQKTELTHRRKVQNMHKKAQMIKQYDAILKNLDRQLLNQKPTGQEQKSQFYLTDIANPQIKEELAKSQSHQKDRKHLISGKKPRINQIHQKLKNYQKQFQQLKQKVGSQNIEQITKKFTEQYQNNFHQYNFINQTYKSYEQANVEQLELLQKKNDLLKQLQAKKSQCKVKQIHEFRQKVKAIKRKKDLIRKDMLIYNNAALELKVYLGQYFNSLDVSEEQKNVLVQDLSDKTVKTNLHDIYEKYSNQFTSVFGYSNRQKKTLKNTTTMIRQNVEDLIDQVKKQGQGSKDNRILTRQELERNTIEMKERKMQGSILNQLDSKYRTKRQAQKVKIQSVSKKASR